MQQQISKMAADINTLTADSKERFPVPREVRFQASCGPWGAPRGHFELIWGGIWAPLGTILGALGVILEPFLKYGSNKRSRQKQTKQKHNKPQQQLAGNKGQQQQAAANFRKRQQSVADITRGQTALAENSKQLQVAANSSQQQQQQHIAANSSN